MTQDRANDPRDPFIVFGSPSIGEEEIAEVVATLRSGWLGTGPKVKRFERMFAEYVGVKHAVALNSCTAAMHLSLLAAGVGSGDLQDGGSAAGGQEPGAADEVITSPLTFPATANVILHAGARPVFADVDRSSMNIDPEGVAEAIAPRTKAILPVHLAGRPCPLDPLLAIARRNNILVIEDAAHAIGARYGESRIGAHGDAVCFSFYATKNITTGEGGMIATRRDDWAEKIRILSLHGLSQDAWKRYSADARHSPQHYEAVLPGFKFNMTDIQASLGIHQLKKLDEFLRRREEIWKRYDDAWAGLPVSLPAPPEKGTRHARHLYTLLLDLESMSFGRDEFRRRLHERGVGTGIHFTALHLHPYYRESLGIRPGRFPNAEWISDRTVSVPLSPKLTDREVDRIIAAVRRAFDRNP